jgi:beta-phosphoglucomutase
MEQIKSKFKAIIFDMDGTIIKTDHIWRRVTLEVLEHHGITELTVEQEKFLLTLSGKAAPLSAAALIEQFDLQAELEDVIAHKLALANKYHLGEESVIEFIEGFELFHNKLQLHSIPTSIATNAHPDNLDGIVDKMQFKRFFGSNIYCIGHVDFKPKPDPAVFLHAAKMLGAKPEECVVFEDSIYGFQAAKAAGMKCIAIKNDLNKDLLHHVHDAIDSYHDAEEALKKI